MITERQEKLLNAIIKEYTESAQPVSSQLIEEKYGFGICPAMIRIEMQKLTDKGFLYQPYISGGRIPTDKGYRFFVDRLLEKNIDDLEMKYWELEGLINKFDDTISLIQSLTKNLALASKTLVLSYFKKEKIFWKEGWEKILKEPEFRKKDYIFRFLEALEEFEKNIEDLKLNSKIKISIGKENRFKKAKDFSIISVRCCFSKQNEGILSLIGPKRMNYSRNIGLVKYLTRLLNNF